MNDELIAGIKWEWLCIFTFQPYIEQAKSQGGAN